MNNIETVCRFFILLADNIEEAKALLVGHPHRALDGACELENHELMPVPAVVYRK